VLVVVAVAARLLVPRLAVDEHEPAAVAPPSFRRWANLWLAYPDAPTGMVFLQPPQVCSLRATAPARCRERPHTPRAVTRDGGDGLVLPWTGGGIGRSGGAGIRSGTRCLESIARNMLQHNTFLEQQFTAKPSPRR
jgi:hypothetical protein